MMERKLSLVPNQSSVAVVQSMVDKLMEAAGVPMKISMKVSIAVDEIYSNIVNYSGASSAEIYCKADETGVELWFEDDGIPYNPLENKDPDITLGIDEREEGGLGIFISKKIMDKIEYVNENGRNKLYMVKHA